MATESYATLLTIPGKQMGHVQLVHLPPCVPPAPLGPPPSVPLSKPPPLPLKHPVSMIAAHESALTTLSLPPSGRFLATTSSRGTLVRIWDTTSGKLLREFRRGADTAEIYGVAFRPDEKEVGVWSDKGTVHVFSLVSSGASYVDFIVRHQTAYFRHAEIDNRPCRRSPRFCHYPNTLIRNGHMRSIEYPHRLLTFHSPQRPPSARHTWTLLPMRNVLLAGLRLPLSLPV